MSSLFPYQNVTGYENAKHEMSICTFFQYCDALETNPLALCPERFMTDRTARLIRVFRELNESDHDMLLQMAERIRPRGD